MFEPSPPITIPYLETPFLRLPEMVPADAEPLYDEDGRPLYDDDGRRLYA